MKKYMLFIITFVILLIAFEMISGMIVTSIFLKDLDMSEIDGATSSITTYVYYPYLPLIKAVIAATFAYVVAQKF
ncbi:hypothetical protein LGQ02_01725 [Bacillus shivajii]|uniref:hypothetical protein n=1 Tax=Bacillus shivajii TaxID=1983719 RepID=UPI001CFA5A14|nr:hypothetical protein [Bacillus shivajii]UCZ53542.1 hypothetical protein LGQ02_01725 [Bacillus shivajii]